MPPLLARHLTSLGHEAQHTADLGLASSSDREVWKYAVAQSAILVTKDEDFVTIRALADHGPAVLWVRIGNTTKQTVLEKFTDAWPAVLAALERGETVIEVA